MAEGRLAATTHGQDAALRLVTPTQADAALWWQWRQETTTRRYNPLADISADELATRLAAVGTELSSQRFQEYRWMVRCEGQTVGTVAMSNPSWRMGYGEISYMLAEAWHGQGLGTKAVRLLVDRLFRETTLHRLFATISEANVASWRLIERLGFVREGLLREHYRIQGDWVNEFIYGLLRREWQAQQPTGSDSATA